MDLKGKLELTWVGKDERPRLEPRILMEEPEHSYTAAERVSEDDIFDNRLIFGDNLLALKALEQEFAGKVKCIFIDPPYNTGSAFTHYEDGLEHSLWLTMMRDRLEILRNLLSEDGSIWITIDDNEAHYLKVLCDEIFGRVNFLTNVVWQKRTSPDNRLRVGDAHDNVLVFCKDLLTGKTTLNQLAMSADRAKDFRNPDDDPRGPWASTDCTAQAGHATSSQFYTLTTPAGRIVELPAGLCWRFTKDRMEEEILAGRIWFGKDGLGVPRKKTYLSERLGQNSWTWWPNNEVGHNQEARKESIALFGADHAFDTPKPERLLARILQIASDPGDLVLDSFAGSGTTGAVAQKMGRRWLMIESGNHCHTHILPRMQKVIDGADQGGISNTVGWKGGGGFRYYRLAPTLLKKDKYGRLVINDEYKPEMLAEAMCKHMGYVYRPSQELYWIHGIRPDSDERSFLYVTTQTLNAEALHHLSEDVGDSRHLVVACCAFDGGAAKIFRNLEVLKIPSVILNQCEFGEEYEERVKRLGWRAPEPQPETPKEAKARANGQESLLSLEAEKEEVPS